MNEAVKRYVEAATSLGNLTKARAEKVARQLVKQGEAASDQVGELVEDLLDRQRKNREAITEMVRAETKRVVRRMGLATTTEVERLETEVTELRKELDDARAAAKRSSEQSAAKRSSKKKSTTKKSSKKKSTTRKSSKQKSATKKKATKKKATKRAAPSKQAAKKTAAKKTAKKSSGGGGT